MEKNNENVLTLFLREKPTRLLLSLSTTDKRAKYISTLSKEINCTYSHTVRLLDEFEKLGLVRFIKVSRVKYVELTEEGKDLILQLEGVVRRLSKIKFEKEKK
ncbi:MAG TPA: hypothetical protein EYP80_00965 [Candidatus Aenigmarchaeota archaeon]|nr:hypothetical protein [Candidatus Aenigmarchaeota archaeon]